MTCIVATKEKGKVIMGADSALSDTSGTEKLKFSKITKSRDALIGYAGSNLAINILEHNFIWPKNIRRNNLKHDLYEHVFDNMRAILKDFEDNAEDNDISLPDVLIGWQGYIIIGRSLFDFNVICEQSASIGCFENAHCLANIAQGTAKERVKKALMEASRRMPGSIRGPFTILEV